MKKCILLASMIFLLLIFQVNAQNQRPSSDRKVAYPEIPRISAYEAYVKYKDGKAIIFHGGGERFSRRHILGAYNLDVKDEMMDQILVKFPKEGIEIFTYCY